MPTWHLVRQGECLITIARHYGFSDYRAIYDHPRNAAFKETRPDPNLIFPGDRIVIPAREAKTFARVTGQTHDFVVHVDKRKLELRILDDTGAPMANIAYTLIVGGRELEGTTSNQGLIEHEIPVTEREAKLQMNGTERTLRIGHLNPLRRTKDAGGSGVQSRLHNLGYAPGEFDGDLGPRTRAAIQAFQSDHDLATDGQISDTLVAKLEEAYGS